MPTVIDSLFLELGVDVSKFSKDQQRAIAKIKEFETQVKTSAGKARGGIASIGDAFKDLAKDSRVGASANSIDNLATKFKNLGMSMKVSGGAGAEGLGGMAVGLGRLLSPAALGAAAVGLLAKGAFDWNRAMADSNALLDRQARLSGMSAANLWNLGEAAKTVGAAPGDVTGNIAALQTAVMGMGIGAGDATAQLVALARLGVPFDFKTGVPIDKLVARVHKLAAKSNYQNLGALRALTMPLMGDALWGIATNPTYDPAQLQKQIAASEPANLNAILQKSLQGQSALGRLDIDKDILAETAYGGTQGLMSAAVDILRNLLGVVQKIADFFISPGTYDKTVSAATDLIENTVSNAGKAGQLVKDLFVPSAGRKSMANAMRILMGSGMSQSDAATLAGSAMQESSMNPFAGLGTAHVGLFQLNKSHQAAFAKRFGYRIGDPSVSKDQQFNDQVLFGKYDAPDALAAMAKVKDLMAKSKLYMDLYERPGDNSLGRRFSYAQEADRIAIMAGMLTAATSHANAVNNTSTSHTKIGDIIINTPSTDPVAHANAVRKGIAGQPLLNPLATGTVMLATRGAG